MQVYVGFLFCSVHCFCFLCVFFHFSILLFNCAAYSSIILRYFICVDRIFALLSK